MQKIEYIEVNKLTPHPQNPRIIKDEGFKKLCQSIKDNPDYFETRPVLCNKEMVIFAGNMRWKAAKELGLDKIPTAIMDISENRQKEIMIRDNQENGEWNFDELVNVFDKDELVEWGFNGNDFDLNIDKFEPKTEEEKKLNKCPECGYEY